MLRSAVYFKIHAEQCAGSLMGKKFGILVTIGLTLGFFFCFTFLPTMRHKPQVYDCFLFYNELELLELRLNEMYDHVDKFVIVEACETFRGQPKSFFYEENKDRFEKYADKIIHIKLTEPFPTENPWVREWHEREHLIDGLQDCWDNDIVFISDLDEVVRSTCIPDIVEKLLSRQVQALVCSQKMYYGYLNRYQGDWPGTVCTTYKDVRRLGVPLIRRLRNMRPVRLRKSRISKIVRIPEAGWHFTSMGGIDRHIKKIESFSHSELDTPEYKTKENLLRLIHSLKLQDIDDSYPRFILENKAYFERLGFIDVSNIQLEAEPITIEEPDDGSS